LDYSKEEKFLTKLLKQYRKELDRFINNDKNYEQGNISEFYRKILERTLVIQNIESRIEMCKKRTG